jgi:hypothetical protein
MSNGIDAWSYSRWSDYKTCPFKFKMKYIMKAPTAGSPAMDRGNAVHKMGEDYIKSGPKGRAPKVPPEYVHFKDELAHLRGIGAMAELPWGFKRDWSWTGRPNWFGEGVWFRMKADAAASYDDNTGLVADWKTGRKYSEHEEQGRIFGAVSLMRFPEWTEVDVRFWYTDQKPGDNEEQWIYTRKDGELIRAEWEKKVRPMFADKRFAPTPNDKCKWCDFAKDKGGPCKFGG